MKFWSNLGLVRTFWASLKKIVRSVFEISVFELADPIPNMDSMGHFQVSSTYSQRVLKLKFWSNLGLVRTLKLGEFKENRSLSFRDIGVRDSRLPNMGSNMRTANLKMAHTAHIGYGVGYLEHRYLEN